MFFEIIVGFSHFAKEKKEHYLKIFSEKGCSKYRQATN